MSQIVLSITALLGASTVSLETVEGIRHAGALRQLTSNQLVLEKDGDPLVIPTAELLRIVFDGPHDGDGNAQQNVLLSDGSSFSVRRFGNSAGGATVELPGNASATIDTRLIRAVRFHAASAKLDAQWRDIVSAEHEGDVVVIRKSAVLLDYLEGAIGEVTEKSVDFVFDEESIEVNRTKLEGIVFLVRQPDRPAKPLCVVHTVDEGVIYVREASLENGTARMMTTAGATLEFPVAGVKSIDFSAGKIVYLSQLKPLSVDVTPKLPSVALTDLTTQLLYAPGINKSLTGQQLQLRSHEDRRIIEQYDRGLALHSRTAVEYRLPDEFGRLRAVAGLDPRIRGDGNVQLSIAADNKVLLDVAIVADQPPVSIDLDISGTSRLRIVVDYGDEVDVADHLNLCNLRVTP